ncbi:MAG: ZIP family metal transporter [Pseudomonadota bacterium]
MLTAFFWGFVAASSLIVGALVVFRLPVHERALGAVMAFGSGVLISAVAFELVEEGLNTSAGEGGVALGLAMGSLVFFVGDLLIDRMGGADRKHSGGRQAEGSALAIVLGIALDGIPESIVLGMTIVTGGGISAAFLAAVLLSNLPESIAASSGLLQAGWARSRILGLWVAIAVVSGVSALLGYGLFDSASPRTIAFVLSFAGGAILTMLADTMMPEAFEHGGKLVGVVTTLGFGLALALSALDA